MKCKDMIGVPQLSKLLLASRPWHPANSNEKPVLEEIQRRASLVWDDYRTALLENPDAIELRQQEIDADHVLVCERDRKVTGFAVILPRDDGEAKTLALQRGAKILHVTANPQALGFYQACGFTGGETMGTRFGPATRMTFILHP